MKRALLADLLEWKASPRRKPLLLRGARQVGKTYLLEQLGAKHYEHVIHCNFEQDPALDGFFQRDLDPHRILSELSIYKGRRILPREHLVVFDEVQASSAALSSLKYFQEQAGDYHVAAAGSLLGIRMSQPGTFPVGKVNLLDLHPMTFAEFVEAMGKGQYAELLAKQTRPSPLPDAFHTDLVDLLRKYLFTGGMPEAVLHFSQTGDAVAIRAIQQEILDSYALDFAKHAPGPDIPKLGLVWDSVPRQLARENKKFLFSALREGARAREYERALRWLQDAGLVHLCRAVTTARCPLEHYANQSCFKIYGLDVGLLGAMARTPAERVVQADRLFTEYRGALTESFVAQELVAAGHAPLHYWRSKGGKAELDFLHEVDGEVVPIEVKAGLNLKSKSLRSFEQQYAPGILVRTNLLNLKMDGRICNVPLYAVSLLDRFARRGVHWA